MSDASISLFFKNFAKHLEKIRDEGSDPNQAYRAQILLSQLAQFEKAIRETEPGGNTPDEALHALFATRDLQGLATWLGELQNLTRVEGVYFLDRDSRWQSLFGPPTVPRVKLGNWLVRGAMGTLADDETTYLLYQHGVPRVLLSFGDDRSESHKLIAGFVTELLPVLVHDTVDPLGTRAIEDPDLIAHSPKFLELIHLVGQAARKNVTILLEGESGTGKEVLANYIHRNSNRADRALVPVNCAAIAPGLIESELFGHEKGSFTGAHQRHIGCVERANHSTLFLDEIGEMDFAMQAKLLRFVQLQEFHRVGGRQKVSVDVRMIAATNRDLKKHIEQGTFREDLYYRLSVMSFRIPPLRHRVEDIVPLARFFIERYARAFEMPIPEVDPVVFQLLAGYPFPGNVRELENLIQKLLVVVQNEAVILPHHLPPSIQKSAPEGTPVLDDAGKPIIWRRQGPSRTVRLSLESKSIGRAASAPSWARHAPRDNDELKQMKQWIQDYAREQTLDLERRFLEDLLERADHSIPEASRMGHINRTLLYKMIDRAKPNGDKK